jgi:hypothetical protein
VDLVPRKPSVRATPALTAGFFVLFLQGLALAAGTNPARRLTLKIFQNRSRT